VSCGPSIDDTRVITWRNDLRVLDSPRSISGAPSLKVLRPDSGRLIVTVAADRVRQAGSFQMK
jgi:hypothetical protein